jgi:hypothetical protein
MAPRRKSTEIKQPTEVTFHVCEQASCIGEITARLDGQEKTDERIEKAVLNLIDANAQERANTAASFEKVSVELAKITTVMETNNKTAELQLENQNKMIEQLAGLTTHTAVIKEQQAALKKSLAEHTKESNAWKQDIENRVIRLERFKYVWYILGVGFIAVLSALAYLAAIVDVFDNNNTKTEQVSSSK